MITNFKLYETKLTKDKVNFEWLGHDKTYKFKNITIHKERGYVPMMGISQVIRQYIKQRWNVPFQIGTETFSGGDSVRVYLSPLKVEENVFTDIQIELQMIFQAGNFNGMEDSYEYEEGKFGVLIDGKEFKFTTKYMFTEYKPKYGTKDYEEYEEWCRMNDEAKRYNM